MPFDGHEYLVRQGWTGKGTGLRTGAISRPLAIAQKRTLSGLGKDRDEAFPFWDHLYAAAASSIKIKVGSDDESENTSDSANDDWKRTKTGIFSNRRPVNTGPSASATPDESVDSKTSLPALSLVAAAKRAAAKRGLYAAFFRGPVLGPEDAWGKPEDMDDLQRSAHLPSSVAMASSASEAKMKVEVHAVEPAVSVVEVTAKEKKKEKKRRRTEETGEVVKEKEKKRKRKEEKKETEDERAARKRRRKEERKTFVATGSPRTSTVPPEPTPSTSTAIEKKARREGETKEEKRKRKEEKRLAKGVALDLPTDDDPARAVPSVPPTEPPSADPATIPLVSDADAERLRRKALRKAGLLLKNEDGADTVKPKDKRKTTSQNLDGA